MCSLDSKCQSWVLNSWLLFSFHCISISNINYSVIQELKNYGLWAKSGLLPNVAKFLVCLPAVYECFCITTAGTIWPSEPKNLLSGSLQKKVCQPHTSLIPLPLYFPCNYPLSICIHIFLWDMHMGRRRQSPLHCSKYCLLCLLLFTFYIFLKKIIFNAFLRIHWENVIDILSRTICKYFR